MLIFLIYARSSPAQTPERLSSNARISVITCSPGEELYEAFGHSAIRVHDPGKVDMVYNYGIFSLTEENFYVNFAKGFLWYKLGVNSFDRFLPVYSYGNRWVIEQELNLSYQQKNDLYKYLEWNRKPENARYKYHYFDDNCATRIMFVLDSVKAINVAWNDKPARGYRPDELANANILTKPRKFEKPNATYRNLVHRYTEDHQWMRLGIDLCQGMPVDKPLNDQQFSFLPDYFMLALDKATLNGKRLVGATNVLHKPQQEIRLLDVDFTVIFLNIIWISLLLIVLFAKKYTRLNAIVYWIILGITSFLGLFILVMWFGTEHYHCSNNLNVLWASPINLVAFIFIKKDWAKKYFKFYNWLLIAILVTWFWAFPQNLHEALLGLLILLAVMAKKLSNNTSEPIEEKPTLD
ncbi:MAG: DUF4105 domain-containing protein [Bacteroidetes bacterium]|nr:DUF4105 domain-containing protein [Bacteroidota bacterium]